MMWHKRSKTEPDLEAAQAKDEAEAQLRKVTAQGRYVQRLTSALIERRALNHFGDEIQITFVPKGHHG